jgi:hypothetical protein
MKFSASNIEVTYMPKLREHDYVSALGRFLDEI